MWQLEVLGAPRLRRGPVDVPLTLKKIQALLLLLALEGPQVRARVTVLLWPQLDEPTARRNLRRELARLREIGAGPAVVGTGDQLGLAADVAVDVQAFHADLHAAQPEHALRRWRGALADGLALPDAPDFDDWLARQRSRLLNAWTLAREAAAQACERRGDLAGALAHVQAQLEQDPLQEQRHREAMRLLAALGQREAALHQFQRCRDLLRDELGLEPMAQTTALADALRHTHAPAQPPAVVAAGAPASLMPDPLPFVGRRHEAGALEAAWRAGYTLLIQGEAGVGKTRLAVDFVSAQGPHALVRCRPSDRTAPYAAFTRVLRTLAGPSPSPGSLPPDLAAELARLLPELGPAPPPLRNDAERARFAEACVAAWHALATDNFDAVVLDDWHWADAASRALVARVIDRRHERQGEFGIGVREVLVFRPEPDLVEPAAGSLGTGWMRQLVGAAPSHLLRLDSLPEEAVLELVQRLSGASAPRRFVRRLLDVTSGNPFFVSETLRHWGERGLLVSNAGRWHTPFDEPTREQAELPVPGSVYATVLERVRRQSPTCCRVLEAASQAVEPFAPALLAPACALSEIDTVEAIDAAVQAQLLREHDSGGFVFAHDLVQQAIDTALAPERRRLVHRRLALAAEAAGAPAAIVARHHEASGERARAVPHWLRAGDEALRLHALREAVEHWQRGLADRPSPTQELELRLRSLRALRAMANVQAAREHCAPLLALAREPGLARAERVEAVTSAAIQLTQAGDPAQALVELDTLPPHLVPAEQRLVEVARATALAQLGRTRVAIEALQRALALPGLTARHRAEMLTQQASAEYTAGELLAADDHLLQAIAIYRGLDDPDGRELPRMLTLHGVTLFQLGRMDEAVARLEEAAAQSVAVGDLRHERLSLMNLASTHLTQLRPEAALAVAQRTQVLLEREPNAALSGMLRCNFALAHLMTGDLGAAWIDGCRAAQEVLAEGNPYRMVSGVLELAELFALLGDGATLQPLLDAVDRLAAADPELLRGMLQASIEMWVARAQAAVLAGDADGAEATLARIEPDLPLEDPRVRQRLQVLQAELALRHGRPEDALALLPATDDLLLADGLRQRAAAVRVDAGHARGTLTPEQLAAARAVLRPPPPATGHAMPELRLHHALATAARELNTPDAAAIVQAAQVHVERLAASLGGHPDLQHRFRARWGIPGP